MIIYKIIRIWHTYWGTFINKVAMSLNGVKYGNNFTSCGTMLIRNYAKAIKIGNYVSINSHSIANPIGGQNKTILVTSGNGVISIGNKVGISNSAIFSMKNIVIENEVTIGAGCKIYDTDFHSCVPEYRLNGNTNIPSAPVVIKERAFIGAHCIILKGVTIGKDSVIGAGSIVTKDIPGGEIWAGVPVRFIRKI
jgi:acetyltransferase-like isoleucine patch superfamily enzyme